MWCGFCDAIKREHAMFDSRARMTTPWYRSTCLCGCGSQCARCLLALTATYSGFPTILSAQLSAHVQQLEPVDLVSWAQGELAAMVRPRVSTVHMAQPPLQSETWSRLRASLVVRTVWQQAALSAATPSGYPTPISAGDLDRDNYEDHVGRIAAYLPPS